MNLFRDPTAATTRRTAPAHRGRRAVARRAALAVLTVSVASSLLVAGFVALAPRSADQVSALPHVAPTSLADPETASVELGVRFSVTETITLTGIRFYQGGRNRGPHTGSIWAEDGTRLRTVEFPSSRRAGWVTATLRTPLTVRAGTSLTASYRAPHGRYAVTENGFAAPKTDGTVTFPQSAGVYSYGTGAPAQVYADSDYLVDIVYLVGLSTDPTPWPTGPTPGPSTTPTPGPTTPPVTGPPATGSAAAIAALPRVPWYGGPAYYAKYPKAAASGWADPSFFPISVFFGKPAHAASLKSIGINTYMGAEHDGSSLTAITSQGMSVLAQEEWSPAEVGTNPRVVGWHASDECEMGLGGCSIDNEAGRLAQQQTYVNRLRALNDGRFIQANFGNGVLGTWWASTTMKDHVGLMDLTSVDKYAYTSPHVDDLIPDSDFWRTGRNPATAGAYGWQQDRMASFSNSTKPNWVFVETAMPFLTEPGARTITGGQIEGAVWNSIIHGASGIAYFQHNNNGQCGTYSLMDCGQALRDKVKQVDAEVQSLAPVLNTQSYAWSFGPRLETALKAKDGYAYIFAMTDGATGAQSLTLPTGVTGTVTVVGENRTIAAPTGTFTDTFAAESTHHVYRIALG